MQLKYLYILVSLAIKFSVSAHIDTNLPYVSKVQEAELKDSFIVEETWNFKGIREKNLISRFNTSVNDIRPIIHVKRFAEDAEMVDYCLESFVSRLRSFISGTTFNAADFERLAPEMKHDLLDLAMYMDENDIGEVPLDRKVKWARKMFQTMSESCTTIMNYTSDNDRHDKLVHDIFQLNAVLVVLFDAKGNPDTEYRHYATNVYRFIRYLLKWQQNARDMDDVPPALQIVIQSQFSKAYVTLRMLERHITDDMLD